MYKPKAYIGCAAASVWCEVGTKATAQINQLFSIAFMRPSSALFSRPFDTLTALSNFQKLWNVTRFTGYICSPPVHSLVYLNEQSFKRTVRFDFPKNKLIKITPICLYAVFRYAFRGDIIDVVLSQIATGRAHGIFSLAGFAMWIESRGRYCFFLCHLANEFSLAAWKN